MRDHGCFPKLQNALLGGQLSSSREGKTTMPTAVHGSGEDMGPTTPRIGTFSALQVWGERAGFRDIPRDPREGLAEAPSARSAAAKTRKRRHRGIGNPGGISRKPRGTSQCRENARGYSPARTDATFGG
jgi:hypothetical protein